MGDKNPKKGKKPKKDRNVPVTNPAEKQEPELISRKKKPLQNHNGKETYVVEKNTGWQSDLPKTRYIKGISGVIIKFRT